MKIALAQMQMVEDMGENFEKSIKMIEKAAEEEVDFIFFPEIQLSPFFPQYEKKDVKKYLLHINHEHIEQICLTCKKHKIMASSNVYLYDKGNAYDASLFINNDGRIKGISKMVHIMQCQYFYEQDYYKPSNEGFKVYDTPFGKIGIVICFDRHIPESIRTVTALGADLVIIPTANTKAEPAEVFEWEMRIQAMHSSVYIAMCNRVGIEGAMNFSGESIIIDPNGDVVKKAGDLEELLIADIDLDLSSVIRKEKPYFRLRRPELYL